MLRPPPLSGLSPLFAHMSPATTLSLPVEKKTLFPALELAPHHSGGSDRKTSVFLPALKEHWLKKGSEIAIYLSARGCVSSLKGICKR